MSTTVNEIAAAFGRGVQRTAQVLASLGLPARPTCAVCGCQIARHGTYGWRCSAGHRCLLLGCVPAPTQARE